MPLGVVGDCDGGGGAASTCGLPRALEQFAARSVAFERDHAVGRDHRARVETGEHDIGNGRDIEGRAPSLNSLERVPELEAEEAGPEAGGHAVETGKAVVAVAEHDLGGLDADNG